VVHRGVVHAIDQGNMEGNMEGKPAGNLRGKLWGKPLFWNWPKGITELIAARTVQPRR